MSCITCQKDASNAIGRHLSQLGSPTCEPTRFLQLWLRRYNCIDRLLEFSKGQVLLRSAVLRGGFEDDDPVVVILLEGLDNSNAARGGNLKDTSPGKFSINLHIT